jgi:hypothetical protein
LNVVVLSPSPKYTPTTENRLAYVVLDTSNPSHGKYPAGTEPVRFVKIVPVHGSSGGG